MLLMNPYEQVNRKVAADRQAQRVRQQQPSRFDLLQQDAKAIVDELRDMNHAAGRTIMTCPGCGSTVAS